MFNRWITDDDRPLKQSTQAANTCFNSAITWASDDINIHRIKVLCVYVCAWWDSTFLITGGAVVRCPATLATRQKQFQPNPHSVISFPL